MTKKLVSTHWEARYQTSGMGYDPSNQVKKFEGEDAEVECRLFAQQMAHELGKKIDVRSYRESKSTVTIYEVETSEELIDIYNYKTVVELNKPSRDQPERKD